MNLWRRPHQSEGQDVVSRGLSAMLLTSFLLLPLVGCAFRIPPLPPGALRPTIAVTSFENRSGFEGQWQLGDGMADLLVSELVRSEHFEVLERQHLDPLVGEINLQSEELFRPEGKVERGKLKNARFQIRGEVTDFSQVRGGSVDFFLSKIFFGGRGFVARVALTITIVDVESGKILASVQSAGEAKAGSAWVEAGYEDIAFGGDAFFQTPLGDATTQAIRGSLLNVIESIDYESWRPTVAAVSPDFIIVSGGAKRGVRAGDFYHVRESAREVTDPQTGDLITVLPGGVVGMLRITSVEDEAAFAIAVEGEGFARGQWLSRVVMTPEEETEESMASPISFPGT